MKTLTISLRDIELTFHKQASLSGMTQLAKSEEILKLFRSISSPRNKGVLIRIENLRFTKDEHTIHANLEIEVDLK